MTVRKADAEMAIRHLASEWARETGYVSAPGRYPSFFDFAQWVEQRGQGSYLQFRSRYVPARSVAQGWLEEELRNWGQNQTP